MAEQPPTSLPGRAHEEQRPAKRVKRVSAHQEPLADGGAKLSGRQSTKACQTCRKLKVRCDTNDTDNDCSRCLRLGQRCLREKRSWLPSTDDEAGQTQLTLVKLERALEDVLEKLNMPALDLYVQPSITRPQALPNSGRESPEEEPAGRQRDVSPAPMNSLIEATQLNGLRPQIRPLKQRRKGGSRRMDSDLISEVVLSLEEAEEMLLLFKKTLSHHLFSASIPADYTIESLRRSSTVLFTAIILVTALHMPGKEHLHEICHRRFLGLVSSSMFDRFHSLDDIRGLCIAALWQPYLSWKLAGLSIRMATELNLHHAFYEAFNEPETSAEARKEALEKARLWYVLYVLDHQSSITYGRPSVMSELRPVKDYRLLLDSEFCTSADRELIAQVTGLVILSRAFDQFGLEPKRTMSGDDGSVMAHMRFTEDLSAWQDRMLSMPEPNEEARSSLVRAIKMHYHFSILVLHSLVLRGQPLDKLSELPASLRPLALKAVEAAHSIIEHFLAEPAYRDEIVGMPLYLHSMIAFAIVFLLKMSPRWHAIGITIDSEQRTLPLVEQTISLLQFCKAGANHMVYAMAKGFARMLRQLRRNTQADIQDLSPMDVRPLTGNAPHVHWPADGSYNRNNTATGMRHLSHGNNVPDSGYYTTTEEIPGGRGYNLESLNPTASFSHSQQQLNWGFQDDELWSVGMGYDLLEPGGRGLASMDFPFGGYSGGDDSVGGGMW